MTLAARFFYTSRTLRRVVRGLADLLLPGVCSGCGGAADGAEGLCDACNERLLSLVGLRYCPRCGTTCGPHIQTPWADGCFACPTPLGRFDQVFRLGPYTTPLRDAIRGLKFHRQLDLVRRLGQLLAGHIAAEPRDFPYDVLVPMPMHWLRRTGRAMDHAALLGEVVAARLDLPLGRELVRIRNTPQQATLSRAKRIQNVRGAFRAGREAMVRDARVLLVDDVTTTGATADEAARVLLRAGAAAVTLAVIAKSEPAQSYAAHWDPERKTGRP